MALLLSFVAARAAPGSAYPSLAGPPAAAGELRAAAAPGEDSEKSVIAKGCDLLLRADYESAEQVFREGVERYPKSSRVELGLGVALYSRGDDDGAVDAFLKASDIAPADPLPYRFLDTVRDLVPAKSAVVAERLKRFDQTSSRNAQTRSGESPQNQSSRQPQIREFVSMIQSDDSSAASVKSNASAAIDTGMNYSDSTDLKPGGISGSVDAGGYSSQSQARGSELRQALGTLGSASSGKTDGAAGGAESSAFQRGSTLLLGGDYAQAAVAFQQGVAQFPGSARLLLGLGVADYSRGLYPQAIDALCKAVDLGPGNPQAYFFLAQAYSASPASTDDVLKRVAAYASSHPASAPAQYYYGLCLWRSRAAGQNRVDEAKVEQLLRSAISLDPSLAEAHFELGVVLASQNQPQPAASEFERAVTIDPQWAEAHYRLGQVYRQAGDINKAQSELQESERLRKSGDTEGERLREEIRRLLGS